MKRVHGRLPALYTPNSFEHPTIEWAFIRGAVWADTGPVKGALSYIWLYLCVHPSEAVAHHLPGMPDILIFQPLSAPR